MFSRATRVIPSFYNISTLAPLDEKRVMLRGIWERKRSRVEFRKLA